MLTLRDQLGVDWQTSQDATLTLMDDHGEPVYVFDLLFTGDRAMEASERETRSAALAAQPPAGCQYLTLGEYPALRCVRHGPNRLAAVAELVAEVRVRYGLDGDDLGYEKLWEWAGSREWREGMVAQLLLMAVQRARWLGVPAEQLAAFVSTAAGPREAGQQPASS